VIERELLVDGSHGGRAFANRAGNPLHRGRAKFASGEQARPARLEWQPDTAGNPLSVAQVCLVQRDIGEPEPTSSSAAQSPKQSELGSAPISDCAGAQAWAIANVSILKRPCASPPWLVSQIALVPRYPKGFWVPG